MTASIYSESTSIAFLTGLVESAQEQDPAMRLAMRLAVQLCALSSGRSHPEYGSAMTASLIVAFVDVNVRFGVANTPAGVALVP